MHIRQSSKSDAAQPAFMASSTKCLSALGTTKVLVACTDDGKQVLGYLHVEPLPSKSTAGVLRIAGVHFQETLIKANKVRNVLALGAGLVDVLVQSNKDKNIVTAGVFGEFKELLIARSGFEAVEGKNWCLRRAEKLTRKLAAYEAPFVVSAADDKEPPVDAVNTDELPPSERPKVNPLTGEPVSKDTKAIAEEKDAHGGTFENLLEVVENGEPVTLDNFADALVVDNKDKDKNYYDEHLDKKEPAAPSEDDDELAMTFDDEPAPKENLGPKRGPSAAPKKPEKEKDEDADGPAPATAGRKPLPHHSGMNRTRVLGFNITDPEQDLVPEEKKADEMFDGLLSEPESDEVITPPVDQPRKGTPGPGFVDHTPAAPLTIRPVAEEDAPLNIFDLDDMQGQTTEFTNADNTKAVSEGTDPVHQPMEVPRNNFERKELDQAEDAKQPGTQMEQFQQKQRSNEKFEQAPRNQAQPNSEEGHTHHGSKKTTAAKAPSEADIKDIISEAEGRGMFDEDTTDAEKREIAIEFLTHMDEEFPDGGVVTQGSKKTASAPEGYFPTTMGAYYGTEEIFDKGLGDVPVYLKKVDALGVVDEDGLIFYFTYEKGGEKKIEDGLMPQDVLFVPKELSDLIEKRMTYFRDIYNVPAVSKEEVTPDLMPEGSPEVTVIALGGEYIDVASGRIKPEWQDKINALREDERLYRAITAGNTYQVNDPNYLFMVNTSDPAFMDYIYKTYPAFATEELKSRYL